MKIINRHLLINNCGSSKLNQSIFVLNFWEWFNHLNKKFLRNAYTCHFYCIDHWLVPFSQASFHIINLNLSIPIKMSEKENIHDIEAPEPPNNPAPLVSEKTTIPPEGGLAGWLAVAGCTICVFTTFGFLNAYVYCTE
jgi:hypothetical protein